MPDINVSESITLSDSPQTGILTNRRVTQIPIEVIEKATGDALKRRVTQQAVEVIEKATGASLKRRITQINIEILQAREAETVLVFII